ncbi:hypothetical protein N1851_018479 [Merluccius polli]|uniref:Integrase catalytic domain-containing protein n=1 Tax=Merluccius polli TaxID=89951 RepID=A0AA47P1C7_MERPO|nr:hypothetical protein N1851_018479 [Merluccius polli]
MDNNKPFTRRVVLSTVNSLYDPLGFLAPVTIQGRLFLRDLTKQAEDWDSPLPGNREAEWTRWRDSLRDLQELQIPCTYKSFSPSSTLLKELCVFADTSTTAIAAVAYLKATTEEGQTEVGFVFGKAKLAPQPDLSIPRLELCAAVLAVEIAELIVEEMDLEVDRITYYSDSKVVLGYIHNQARRLFINIVQRIRQSISPDQWRHVPSNHNPADHGSRSIPAALLSSTTWLSGPAFLRNPSPHPLKPQETFNLVNPASDSDLRPEIAVNLTVVSRHLTDPTRFERFSKWTSLTTTVARLIHIARSFALPAQKGSCRGWHICPRGPSEEEMDRARIFVMKSVQHELYAEELKSITSEQSLPPRSSLSKLQPFINSNGLLRVGGRIAQSKLATEETNPIIIPGRHHLANLLVRHHHHSKRWAVMFSCMCTRAVHIEVIEAMSASSCINALRRFFAIRGPAKQIRLDQGTNFIGACRELNMDKPSSSSETVEKYLQEHDCTWVFNPPHSSHMGGAWERMIDVARRILDCMLLQCGSSRLTHKVLATLMAEITAVMNARPFVPRGECSGPYSSLFLC